MSTVEPKSTPILDWLLQQSIDAENRLVRLEVEHGRAINMLAESLSAAIAVLQGRIVGTDVALRRDLDNLWAASLATVDHLKTLGESHEVTEIKHLVRNGNGDIERVIITEPTAGP